ncbi:MAG TPA: DMT family transporter [Frankiaceae bacterium]|jgi:drug/metabolite transporter (DMT)-like permease|nr:DMT family transporter [Frankiaceae bacterium]
MPSRIGRRTRLFRTPTALRYAPVGMLLLACICWGLSTALSKIALEQLTATDLFGIEIVVAAVPLAGLALARGARPSRPDPRLLLLGILEPGLAYLLFDIGVRRTAASHAALLLALDAPATLLLSVAFLRERIDRLLLVALTFGVAGSVLVTWRTDGSHGSVTGDLLVIASAATAAGYAVLARHVATGRDPVVVTAVQMLGALSLAAPIFLWSIARGHSHIARVDAGHFGIALAVALLGSVIPFLLFNKAITQMSASRAGLIGVLVPVIGAGASVPLLGEQLGAVAVIGGTLAIVAALIAARRPDNSRPARKAQPAKELGEPAPGPTVEMAMRK